MGSRRKPSVASCFMCRSRVDGKKRNGTGPVPPTEARCCPGSKRAGGCVWPPQAHQPFLASSLRRVSRCREGTPMVPCALLVLSAHHKPSTGGRSNNGEDLDRGREKGGKQDRSWVGPGTTPALQAEAGWFPIARDTTCASIPC